MKNMISGEQKLDKRINDIKIIKKAMYNFAVQVNVSLKRKMPLKIARSNSNILNPL